MRQYIGKSKFLIFEYLHQYGIYIRDIVFVSGHIWPKWNVPHPHILCWLGFEVKKLRQNMAIRVKIWQYSENSRFSIFEYLHQYWIYPWSDFFKKCLRSFLTRDETFQVPSTCLGWDMKNFEVITHILTIFEIVIFHHIAEISAMAEISGLHIVQKKTCSRLFYFAKKIIWIGCIKKIWQTFQIVSFFLGVTVHKFLPYHRYS